MPFFETFLSLLFPDSCVGCSSRGSLLCPACRAKLAPAPASSETFILSAYAYADPRVRRLVKLLKYKNTRHAAGLFGAELSSMLSELLGEESLFLGDGPVLVVPVPLSKGRRRMRGYNQAELLARAMLPQLAASGVAAVLDIKLLEKIRETGAQADSKIRSARLTNLGDCFSVASGRRANGETIILVDDVSTTGATLLACKKALQKAGFRNIFALTVAH